MLRKLLLSKVAVIGPVAVSQSARAQVIYVCLTTIRILFEVAAGASCARSRFDLGQLESDRSKGRHTSTSEASPVRHPARFARELFRRVSSPASLQLRVATYLADIYT
jgi:hypothetical protein